MGQINRENLEMAVKSKGEKACQTARFCVQYFLMGSDDSDKFMILGGYQMFSILATESASSAGWISMVVWLVILFAFMYFFMVRPQKKEQQKKNSTFAELAVGDTVLTTSGFTEP